MLSGMSWTSIIDSHRRLIYTRVSENLTYSDAAAHRVALAGDPCFDPTFSHVLDLRAVTRVVLAAEDVRELASHSALAAPAKQFIVAPSDVAFGISRMYGVYRDDHPEHEHVSVCRTLAEACEGLGIEELPALVVSPGTASV